MGFLTSNLIIINHQENAVLLAPKDLLAHLAPLVPLVLVALLAPLALLVFMVLLARLAFMDLVALLDLLAPLVHWALVLISHQMGIMICQTKN